MQTNATTESEQVHVRAEIGETLRSAIARACRLPETIVVVNGSLVVLQTGPQGYRSAELPEHFREGQSLDVVRHFNLEFAG